MERPKEIPVAYGLFALSKAARELGQSLATSAQALQAFGSALRTTAERRFKTLVNSPVFADCPRCGPERFHYASISVEVTLATGRCVLATSDEQGSLYCYGCYKSRNEEPLRVRALLAQTGVRAKKYQRKQRRYEDNGFNERDHLPRSQEERERNWSKFTGVLRERGRAIVNRARLYKRTCLRRY